MAISLARLRSAGSIGRAGSLAAEQACFVDRLSASELRVALAGAGDRFERLFVVDMFALPSMDCQIQIGSCYFHPQSVRT